MAARTVAKDIITLRGSATIVSEFFGIHIIFLFSRFPPISLIFAYLCIFCELLPDLFFGDFFKLGYAAIKFDPCILHFLIYFGPYFNMGI